MRLVLFHLTLFISFFSLEGMIQEAATVSITLMSSTPGLPFRIIGVQYQHLQEVEHVEKKLDINALIDSKNNRALHLAVSRDASGGFASVLLKAGANPDVQNDDGQTPLHWACDHLSIANIRMILKHNANPNIPDKKLNTALHLLCLDAPQTPETKIAIKLLLAYGTNPLATDKKNETPLQKKDKKESRFQLRSLIMRIYNHKKAAYLLLLKGKDPQNSPFFGKLQTDLTKLILDINHPGWPLPSSTNPADLLSFLQEK